MKVKVKVKERTATSEKRIVMANKNIAKGVKADVLSFDDLLKVFIIEACKY